MDIFVDDVMQVQLDEGATMPTRAHADDSGIDLCANEDVCISSMTRKMISTGLKVMLPVGSAASIRPRSGLAAKHGIMVLGGEIDEGYRGELKVVLYNSDQVPFEIKKGDRIAQLVIYPVIRPRLVQVEELGQSDRGEAGFGSTGV